MPIIMLLLVVGILFGGGWLAQRSMDQEAMIRAWEPRVFKALVFINRPGNRIDILLALKDRNDHTLEIVNECDAVLKSLKQKGYVEIASREFHTYIPTASGRTYYEGMLATIARDLK